MLWPNLSAKRLGIARTVRLRWPGSRVWSLSSARLGCYGNVRLAG